MLLVVCCWLRIVFWQTAAELRGDAKLIKEDIFELDRLVAERRSERQKEKTADADAAAEDMDADAAAERPCETSKKHKGANSMLVDTHRPKSFINLLSEERTNRNVLSWLKDWDPIVFGKKNGQDAPAHGIYIYIFVYMYLYTHIHIYIYTHTHIYIYIHTYIYIYIYGYLWPKTGPSRGVFG